ncbi:hypothetical protein P4K96_09275 [Bacillus cereus]|nr:MULTISPECIES: hypothetical protein [Paenibacillus]MEB9893732.1 hypothetical protein [Bacillus cereus]
MVWPFAQHIFKDKLSIRGRINTGNEVAYPQIAIDAFKPSQLVWR